ncbi:MAG: DUF4270 domain-containing protein [Saprospiraceae bacterium]|nr:DUF4270 domain-containing protein [Saprospiraceae bacterium]
MSKKTISNLSWVLMIAVSFVWSCQDPILVGNDLLDDERLELKVSDNFDLSSQTIVGEKVTTYRPSVDTRTYLLGQLNDDLFGKVSAELYMKFNMLSSTKANYHLEQLLKFDSLVLVLGYDSLATYARSIAAQKIEVLELSESFAEKDTFYSDASFQFKPDPLAVFSTVIRPKDSVSVVNHVTRKVVRQAPQLRIKLSNDFGTKLINDENAAKNDTAFAELFKGIYIKSTPVSSDPFIYGFNLTDGALSTQNPVNKLIMYYNVASGDTTLRKTYEYLINTATINRYVHDRTGSKVEEFILNPAKGDSLTFLQGVGGVKTIVKFNDLKLNDSLLINKAELEVTVAQVSGQNGAYDPPLQLIASHKKSDGKLELIKDISQLINTGVNFSTVFGGKPVESNNVITYTINITNHIKSAVKDSSYASDLYLGILTESETARRAVLYGAGHSTYPMKLKITYTKNK